MAVRSTPLSSSHVFTAEQLSQAEPRLRRFLALVLWLLSYAGNVLAFGGGWETLGWNQQLLVALVCSLVYQIICTLVQLICCHSMMNPLYLIALGASGIPSFIGYRTLVAVPLTTWLTGQRGDLLASSERLAAAPTSGIMLAIAVHALVFIGLVAVDIIPERVFVKH